MAIRIDWRDQVIVVTLNRPERRNAVDHETLTELRAAQHEARHGGARAFVLTGEPPAFCAGADLTGVDSNVFASALLDVLTGFGELPMATIAAIRGPALGAGTQLAMACDLRVATLDSVFGIPAAKLGLAIDQWTTRRLCDEFGFAVARNMLLTAATYSADSPALAGFVHRQGDLADAMVWADQISELAPLTIAAHKLALQLAAGVIAEDVEFEAARNAAWDSEDAAEGRLAFLEKRQPRFRGV
jgi:enoyl-CoA hydratase